jgi:hypothetical protein
MRSSNGSALAVICATGKLTLWPALREGSAGSIAISHNEQVACSPVSDSGATIVYLIQKPTPVSGSVNVTYQTS